MSGLSGYLLNDGRDLSSVFLTNGGATFTNAITTSGGIMGPSAGITYSAGMIGYSVTVPATKSSLPIASGTYTTLMTSAFTMPIGVYLVVAYVSNTYAGGVGTLSFINIYVSTSSALPSGGFGMTALGTASLPVSGTTISAGVSNIIQNTAATTYYLAEIVNFTSIAVTSSATASNSYVIYTRLA